MARPMSRRSKALAVIGLLAGIVAFGAYRLWRLDDTLRDTYAAWWAGEIVVEYLRTHDGKWPSGNDDLSVAYETLVTNSGTRPFTFADIMGRCEVRFDVRSQEVLDYGRSHAQPLDVVRYRRGGQLNHWERRDPNRTIFEYLTEKANLQHPVDSTGQ